jgi:hypothetical protein
LAGSNLLGGFEGGGVGLGGELLIHRGDIFIFDGGLFMLVQAGLPRVLFKELLHWLKLF